MRRETTILIPSYNGATLLSSCLSSLRDQDYQNFKTVVINDASTDDTAEHLQVYFPEVDVVTLPHNGGFAKAVNSGLHYAIQKYDPRFIAILNNDTTVDKKWLESLVERMHTDAHVAAVTSNMFFYNHPEIINSQGGTLDWNGDGYDINFGIHKDRGEKESTEVIGACFGAALVRAEVFGEVGFLDEAFGAYFEDLDWSWRARLYGYRVLFEPEAVVYHQHSASYNRMPYKKLYFCKRNALRAALKNYEGKNLFRSLTYIFIGYWFAMVGYFQTSKHRLPFLKKLGFMSIPFLAFFWNITHLFDTLRNRKKIQHERRIPDESITRLAKLNLAPVREWMKHLKERFPISKKMMRRKVAHIAAPLQRIGQEATHRMFFPMVERIKHRIVLPLINRFSFEFFNAVPPELENLNRYLMGHTLFRNAQTGDFPSLLDDKTIHAYFRMIFANLPFHLSEINKEDLFKNESALVIDACICFFQLSLCRNKKDFGEVLNKIHQNASQLRHARVDWREVIAFAKKINASSQLYGNLHLVAATEDGIAIPQETIETLRQNGSRVQNILLDKINIQKFFSGKPPFFLKLYSKMYMESGLIARLTVKIHALYNKLMGVNPKSEIQNSTPKHLWGVNIFGFLDSESGVGEAARIIARAVVQKGIPHALLNSSRCAHRKKENEFSKKFSIQNPYPVNIVVFYGDVFENEIRAFGEQRFQNKYNIAYWAWELSSLPASWTALLKNVNEVWVPSSFVAKAIHEAKKDIPVTVIPHAITIKKYPYPRKRFGLPSNTFLFLFIFDFYSIFERKNPLAIIRAFKNAFLPDEQVALVIKSSNHAIDPENFEKLKRESETHNIFLLSDYLSRDEISSLINVCDAYVSLHRSEGFGLTIAEAMALGKPVVATNYSGNADFMNEENSFPIPYKLITLENDHGPYKEGNVWADPDEGKAAKAMRIIHDYPEIAGRKGAKARSHIIEKLNPATVADVIANRLARIKQTF